MPVYSMTGYAAGQSSGAAAAPSPEAKTAGGSWLGLEIRSVNSRFLDLAFRLPEELRPLEPMLRDMLAAQLKRGKVEVRATVESGTTHAVTEPSARLLQRLASMQDNIQAWLPDVQPLRVADVLRLASSEQSGPRDWRAEMTALAEKTLRELLQARKREGARLAATLIDKLGEIRNLARQAAPLVPQLVAAQRQRFLDRWNDAMQSTQGAGTPSTTEAAQDRALSEATAFAIRIDVAEEITRLESHLDELERLLNKGGEIGKRLDFLIQELHREANTLGSKSAALELTHISVDMKVLIEQMREQVQNIE
ncbi:MAG: YicC family protein [Rhodoferax sp.]|nr:YicC family protein [Rhodoferax sp.]MCW5641161.1 YicC family protein [Rhodoferax sp.]